MPQEGRSIANNHIGLLRRSMRLTQRELAMLLSMHLGTVIDITTISRHEATPASRHPSQAELLAYASVFKVPVIALYADIYTKAQVYDLLAKEGDWVFVQPQEEQADGRSASI